MLKEEHHWNQIKGMITIETIRDATYYEKRVSLSLTKDANVAIISETFEEKKDLGRITVPRASGVDLIVKSTANNRSTISHPNPNPNPEPILSISHAEIRITDKGYPT